jgi:hypothetical protein
MCIQEGEGTWGGDGCGKSGNCSNLEVGPQRSRFHRFQACELVILAADSGNENGWSTYVMNYEVTVYKLTYMTCFPKFNELK